jgi:hypothetical protein
VDRLWFNTVRKVVQNYPLLMEMDISSTAMMMLFVGIIPGGVGLLVSAGMQMIGCIFMRNYLHRKEEGYSSSATAVVSF